MQTVLDDYDIVTQVPAPGGMGLVYQARRPSGDVIALKIVPVGQTADSEAVVRSERRGAQVQQLLTEKDPHVPRVYGFGEKHGVFFIEMEFIDGEDLSSILARRGPLPPRDAVRIALEVAAFLEAAHHTTYGEDHQTPAELVHSDLKPENIRVASETGEIKILDFGIAKARWHTATTNQFGSLPYMSPERIEGRIDRHVDYWALGVVLYQMLAGNLPFRVHSGLSQPQQIQQLILSRCPPLPLPATVPVALQAIVAKMLRGDQARRYQDAAEIKADLQAFLAGGSPVALRDFKQPHEGATIVVTPPPSMPTLPAKRPLQPPQHRKSRRQLLLALAVLPLVVDVCAVRRASHELGDELRAEIVIDPDIAWRRYQDIRSWAVIPILMPDVGSPLKDTLVTAADRVLADFRSETPAVRASDWEEARRWLENAASLDGSDLRVKARLLCAEAHLLRIQAEQRGDDERTDLLRLAVERFDDATRLDNSAPDAYVGLARIYSSGLVDYERASNALAEAERRGQPLGRRGHAQLGDTLKARADRLRLLAYRMRGLPEESTYLRSALDDYERALAYYDKAPGFGFVADSVRLIHRRIDQIHSRLTELES